ncbi:hypothetical protein [Hymenobacter wooponensis]|uniref:Lipoprotein n=1 Tax=Hymenobacter wooponensis TaxID=1525360 RepID=A0A4Z0MJ62_9BACT|nr:hypothetical protein [Hymenobacter wooponensis]TGD79584.1 hypothetical protein EU557_15285 [Hymenobacter wooponensis]
MKKYLLLVATSMSLLACDKNSGDTNVVPAAVSSTFDQEFTLNYRQQALLPSATRPELVVEATDLTYSFCPKNARCFVPDFVWPTLTITDAQGQTQQVKLPVNQERTYAADLLDSTSVRANGRRYVLYYLNWQVQQGNDDPQRKDIAMRYRIGKVN